MIGALQRRYETFFADRPGVPFAVADAGAEPHRFGAGEPVFTITVRDPRAAKALTSLDQFGVAVAYLEGWLDIDGDLATARKMRRFFREIHPVKWASQFVPALVK